MRSGWTEATRRRVVFGALALGWLLLGVFGLLGLPAFAAVFVLGLLALKTLEPDESAPNRTVVASRRNVALGIAALAAFVPVAAGPGLLLGTIDLEIVLTLAGVLSAVVLVLALAAETEDGDPARLGKRELVRRRPARRRKPAGNVRPLRDHRAGLASDRRACVLDRTRRDRPPRAPQEGLAQQALCRRAAHAKPS